MSYHRGRTGSAIRDTAVFQVINRILVESPELVNSVWLSHRIQMINAIEDEGERAPPLSVLFEVNSKPATSYEKSDLNVLEMLRYTPHFFLRRNGNE